MSKIEDIREFAIKLKELKGKDPYKFYELKGIVEGIDAIQTGKGIEGILNKESMWGEINDFQSIRKQLLLKRSSKKWAIPKNRYGSYLCFELISIIFNFSILNMNWVRSIKSLLVKS